MDTDRVVPFHSGSQAADWESRNCDCCKKYDDCPILQAVNEAYFTEDGTMSAEMAKRMGVDKEAYTWDCPEKETIE